MALVLTRRFGEAVIFDGGRCRMTVEYPDRGENTVKLVFDAPRDFEIVREEIWLARLAAAGRGTPPAPHSAPGAAAPTASPHGERPGGG